MKKRRKVGKDQRMIKSRRVSERCGHRQKRKREKGCFFSSARNRALSIGVHSIPPSQMSSRDECRNGYYARRSEMPSHGRKIGWGEREGEREHIHHLPEMCVGTLLARMRTCCQRSTASQPILAAAGE